MFILGVLTGLIVAALYGALKRVKDAVAENARLRKRIEELESR